MDRSGRNIVSGVYHWHTPGKMVITLISAKYFSSEPLISPAGTFNRLSFAPICIIGDDRGLPTIKKPIKKVTTEKHCSSYKTKSKHYSILFNSFRIDSHSRIKQMAEIRLVGYMNITK